MDSGAVVRTPPAFSTLDVVLDLPLMLDDSPRLIHTRNDAVQGLIAPRAEFIGFVISGGKRQVTTAAEVHFGFAAIQVGQDLDAKTYQNVTDFRRDRVHS